MFCVGTTIRGALSGGAVAVSMAVAIKPIALIAQAFVAGAALRDGALGGILSPGNGELRGRLLRVNHYGRAADPAAVADALGRLAAALDRPAPTA